MKTPQTETYTPSEKRRVLRGARDAGELSYDKLDRLLLEACSTPSKMQGLLRSLKGVRIVDSEDVEDVMNASLELAIPFEDRSRRDFYRLYAEQVRSLRRLSRSEEHALARRLEFARARVEQVVKASKLPAETRERIVDRGINCQHIRDELEELQSEDAALDVDEIMASLPCAGRDPLVQNMCMEYSRIRAHFVERNLYLVIGMSAAYRTYGIPVMDLIQEGNASLIRAVEKFDWRKNVRFQTYAAFWIRQAIERLITANRGIVRVPNYIQQKMRRLRREGKLPRNHKDMDLRDVSMHFDTTAEGAARLMETDRSWYSLDVPLGDDEGSFAAMLEADEPDEAMSSSEKVMLGERLDDVMTRHLTEQERDIITMRFGLGGTAPRTLDQIGEEMCVSRERIRQMQVKALDKLHKRQLMEELRDFL